MKDYEPTNSFKRRPSLPQIIAYVLVLAQFLIFTSCLQSRIDSNSSRISLCVVYYTSFVGVIIAALLASCADPSDQHLKQKEGESKINAETPKLFCQICRSAVHANTRHCKLCDTCVQGFDHHCVWINNCIGRENYAFFIVMIVCLDINFLTFLAGVLVLWLEWRWDSFLGAMIASWTIGVVLCVFTLLLTGLIGFHIFLKCQRKTTYEYLISKIKERAIVFPQRSEHREKSESNINDQTNSHLKFSMHQQLGSLEMEIENRSRQKSEAHLKNDKKSMVFEDNIQQISRRSSSSKQLPLQNCEVKNVQLEMESNKVEERSEKETNLQVTLRKNKSLSLLVGTISFVEPEAFNYKSQINPGKRIQKEAVVKVKASLHI